MKDRDLPKAVRILKSEIRRWKDPAIAQFAAENDPFLVLISTLLSLRTKDAVTVAGSNRLFALARTPEALLKLTTRRIEKAIYPVSFFRVKARSIHAICSDLLSRFGGKVPSTIDELLTLQGVGRKTANLVVTLGFRKPGICVDIHVHRISNRWGYVRTKDPAQTEDALRRRLPRRYWMIYNDLLVPYGQNLCTPVSPWCSRCRLSPFCERRGVGRAR